MCPLPTLANSTDSEIVIVVNGQILQWDLMSKINISQSWDKSMEGKNKLFVGKKRKKRLAQPSQTDYRRQRPMRAVVSFTLQRKLHRTHLFLAIMANIRAISCSQAVKWDLLVAYPLNWHLWIEVQWLCTMCTWWYCKNYADRVVAKTIVAPLSLGMKSQREKDCFIIVRYREVCQCSSILLSTSRPG